MTGNLGFGIYIVKKCELTEETMVCDSGVLDSIPSYATNELCDLEKVT